VCSPASGNNPGGRLIVRSGDHLADEQGEMGSVQMGTTVLVGAAGLALWVDIRLGHRCPGTSVKVLVHAALASVAVRLGAGLTSQLLDGGSRARTIVVLCLVVLPGWVYAFLVSLWTMKLLRSALPR
jgi:hypothetical protein